MSSLDSFWNDCLVHYKSELPPLQFSNWIEPLKIKIDNQTLLISAPNSFVLKIIQERFLNDISARLINALPSISNVELCNSKISVVTNKKIPLDSKKNLTSNLPEVSKQNYFRLNELATFRNFVTGKTNQLAHAAAMQVANNPGFSYNPLFIYGGVGLGKTHLIQAIGNQLQDDNNSAKIHYVHATNYISEVIRAIQNKKFDEHKLFYDSLDLLLIDDIQFIAEKAGTQQQFFYTLNSLIDNKKQVVITCDTFPKELSGIESRLTSRFSSGLTVEIEPPNFEMRVAILLQKSIQLNNPISEDVAFFIAKHVRSNVRELEGALNRINAFSKFHIRKVTIDLAKEALKDLIAAQHKQVSIENIQKTVADFYHIKLADLLSKKKARMYARPRQIAMCLARDLTQLSLPEIGAEFGGRDHSTVLHACKTVESLKKNENSINIEFSLLSQTLKN